MRPSFTPAPLSGIPRKVFLIETAEYNSATMDPVSWSSVTDLAEITTKR